jgi:transcriptional regulator with XRE-family HTH domain
MSKKAEPTPSAYALEVAAEIQRQLDTRQPPVISGRDLARKIQRSANYVNMRLRGHAAFTLTDISAIAVALDVPITDIMSPGRTSKGAKVTPIGARSTRELEAMTARAALHDTELDD